MTPPPELEETDVVADLRPGRSAVLLAALFLLVAAAVIAGILLVWAAIEPVLPSAGLPLQRNSSLALAGD